MTEPMRVDAAGLRASGPAFTGLSALVDETLRQLGRGLDAEGSCWGGDETGAAFGASYAPAAAGVREALAWLRGGLAGVGESLLSAADNVENAEGRAGHRFS